METAQAYDILSFDSVGKQQLLEVKTTNGSALTPFFLSCNECAVAAKQSKEWQLYRVHFFAKSPRIFILAPPLNGSVKLTTEIYRASFKWDDFSITRLQSNLFIPWPAGGPLLSRTIKISIWR